MPTVNVSTPKIDKIHQKKVIHIDKSEIEYSEDSSVDSGINTNTQFKSCAVFRFIEFKKEYRYNNLKITKGVKITYIKTTEVSHVEWGEKTI